MASTNPFEIIDQRLADIENSLHQLINKPEPEPPSAVKYLTTDQVCNILSVSRVSIWNWEKSGILRSFRIGNLKRFKLSDIEALGEIKKEQSGAV